MGKPQRQFGTGFEAKAVRLVEVSRRRKGRSPWTSASAFRRCGAGSTSAASTRSRRRRPTQEDLATELKRLPRENEILRQERRS